LLCIFDVDGVLTNGQIAVNDQGEVSRTYDMQDGLGVQALMQSGVDVAWVSGGVGNSISARATQLGVTHCFTGVANKLERVKLLKARWRLDTSQVAYVADDVNDLAVRPEVGLFIAVNNAREELKKVADLVVQRSGGFGAVREVCDLLCQAKP
jgi:3-deoxy-D-manno-octulosonate 8-phosphate phosphatase (KDO 8-P phosphatase)